MPTKAEWQATVAFAVVLGCVSGGAGSPPSLTDDPGTGCLSAGLTSFNGVQSAGYWSSSAYEGNPGDAWVVVLVGGNGNNFNKFNSILVWPVRGGR